MKLDFMYEEDIIQYFLHNNCVLEDNDETPLECYMGFAVRPSKTIIINLSSICWNKLTDDELLEKIPMTITHEYVHLLITEAVGTDHNLSMEDKVCEVAANQRGEVCPVV